MTLNLRCRDYGFECDFTFSSEDSSVTIEKFREHFEEEHGIDYAVEVVTQMITNRGYSLESIR